MANAGSNSNGALPPMQQSSAIQQAQNKRRSRTSFDRRQSQVVEGFGRRGRKIQYEPTYRMEPKALFPAERATTVIQEVLEKQLNDVVYDGGQCMQLCETLAVEIKDRVKDFKADRYRLIAVVTMGPIHNNEVLVASRCLFCPECDTWASYTYENNTLFAVGTIFAVYKE